MRQKGYLTVGLGIALAIASAALWLTFNRLSACAEARATERAQFEVKLAEFDAKLAQQNEAIKEWQERATKAGEAARQALAAERARGKNLVAEAARLRALKGQSAPSECPAGEAVKRLRTGLK